jgi:hypothetical protein
MSDLVDRLRGIYRTPIKDGLGPVATSDEPENPKEYIRHFGTPPIQHEAAEALEILQRAMERIGAAGDHMNVALSGDLAVLVARKALLDIENLPINKET